MADHMGNTTDVALQRHVTTLVLDHIGSAGFALAGSGAIREHGITDRPTNDVDLFTTSATSPEAFAAAVTDAEHALTNHGYRVIRTRTTPEFARVLIETSETSNNRVVEVDFGIDWRNEPPTQFAIGPVLALRDAVGSKVAAVYSRGEARDFLDLDAIRRSGHFTDGDLLALAKEHDPGFELDHFIDQLQWVNRIRPGRTSGYGVDAEHLDQIKTRVTAWAEELAALEPPPPSRPTAPRPPDHLLAPPADQPYRGQHRDPGGPSIGF
jgi:hypothetical protein